MLTKAYFGKGCASRPRLMVDLRNESMAMRRVHRLTARALCCMACTHTESGGSIGLIGGQMNSKPYLLPLVKGLLLPLSAALTTN